MSSLGDRLRQLYSNSDDLYVPEFDNESTSEEQSVSVIDLDSVESESDRKKSKKKSTIDEIMSNLSDIDKRNSGDDIDDFDEFLELMDDADEDDVEFRNSIIDAGRKYARETAISQSTSEIQKIFSSNEKKLQNLINEIREDKRRISDTMSKMSPRAASPKALSELQETKNTLHNAELSAIKESNSMKKTEVELSLKAKSQKSEEQGSMASGNLIRDLFSVGRKDMISGMGGYEGISGSFEEDDEETESASVKDDMSPSNNNDDEYIQKKYFSEEQTEDNFVKYIDSGGHYILEIDGDGNKRIYAEDRDGNVLNDYPLPTDTSQLSFEFDDKDNIATDDFFRRYEVRRV